MRKSDLFSKTKIFGTIFLNSFWIYIPVLVISFLLHNNLIHNVWVYLLNKRQQRTDGFLDKISESHGMNISRGQWVLPENYNYLNPTELLDLCCSIVQFILFDCGSIVVVNIVTIFKLSLSFTEKIICRLTFYVL